MHTKAQLGGRIAYSCEGQRWKEGIATVQGRHLSVASCRCAITLVVVSAKRHCEPEFDRMRCLLTIMWLPLWVMACEMIKYGVLRLPIALHGKGNDVLW